MDSLELYRIFHEDPLSTIVRVWSILGEIDNFTENISGYFWNGAGNLPVLRFRNQVFTKHHILDFLRHTFDFDTDLNSEEIATSKMIEEICVSRLYPSTLYSMWVDESTPKHFFNPKQHFLIALLTLPVTKIQFLREKDSVKVFLEKQHGIVTNEESFFHCDKAHEILSQILGKKKFFFSKKDRKEMPSSADIIVYGFLRYEIVMIRDHSNVKNSLMRFPNLMDFLARIEGCLKLKIRIGGKGFQDFQMIVENNLDDEEFYIGKVYERPLRISDNQRNKFEYRLGGQEPFQRLPPYDSTNRRIYITATTFFVLFIFYIRERLSR